MSLQDTREILLDQHDALRVKICEARRESELWRRGAGSREELQRLLGSLSEQLEAHHTCEERILRDLIPTLDEGGRERAARMTDAHIDVHRELLASLGRTIMSAGEEDGAATIKIILDLMLDHMRDEEEYLLASDALAGDLRFGEGFAG